MRGPDRPTDPVRQQLVEVRRGLLGLHKTLLDSERAAYEEREGVTSGGLFLQLLLQDPFFAWLRPFSSLVAEIDESLAADDGVQPETAERMIARVRELVLFEEVNSEETRRYDEVRTRDPNVLFAHVELSRKLKASF